MKIVRESADTLCSSGLYMGPTHCLNGTKIAGYDSPDGYAFGLDKEQGKMKVSKPGESHASMDLEYEKDLGWQDEYENLYEGRLWTDHKIITFWKYPPVKEFERFIKLIEDELKRKEGVDIDMWNDSSWKVEVIISPIDGKPSWDSNFSSIVPMQYSTVLMPLQQYGGSAETERVPHEASPLSPEKMKRKVPYGFGSKHPKAESRAKWRMAKPFESFVPKSLDEALEFERGKDPKAALDIGKKGYRCGQCGAPTTENGENIAPDSESYEETINLWKKSPEKIIDTYCSDCYYNDQAMEQQAESERQQEEYEERQREEQRWEEENNY